MGSASPRHSAYQAGSAWLGKQFPSFPINAQLEAGMGRVAYVGSW